MRTVSVLAGQTVHQIRVGYDLRLVVSDAQWSDENEVQIVVDGPCKVRLRDGSEHEVRLLDAATIPPLLDLQGKIISSASADGGTLKAELDDGALLSVPPLAEYEAWRIEGRGDELVVCLPGGELL